MSDLSAEIIGAALQTRRLGHEVLYYASIGSTNDVAKEQAAAGAAEGLLVVADEQTAGRGRAEGRSWWGPPGSSLLMSLLLRPPLPAARAQEATMCLGLGALEGIEELTGLQAALKWPNDLVLEGRKLAGMLTEMELGAGGLAWVVLGLGLNANLDPEEAPEPEVTASAISLSAALEQQVSRPALLAAILGATERWYERLLAGAAPHSAWAARLDTIGRHVTVTQAAGRLRGRAIGVDEAGALLVQTSDGRVHTIWAGDVTTVRTAGAEQ